MLELYSPFFSRTETDYTLLSRNILRPSQYIAPATHMLWHLHDFYVNVSFQQLEFYDTCSFLPSFCWEAEAIIASLHSLCLHMIYAFTTAPREADLWPWSHVAVNMIGPYSVNTIGPWVLSVQNRHEKFYALTKGTVICWNGSYPFTCWWRGFNQMPGLVMTTATYMIFIFEPLQAHARGVQYMLH
jgi:hypothetical protein